MRQDRRILHEPHSAALEPAEGGLFEVMAQVPSRAVDPVATMRVALDLGLGASDSAYLVLSRATGQPVVTADRRLFDVGVAAGYEVAWLGDLPLG